MFPPVPPKIDLANTPTPFRLLANISDKYKTRIWLKEDDKSGFTLSGNKVRKLEFLLSDALDQNAGVVITCGGLQSNHCRATAAACAQMGIKCHLILREGDNPNQADVPDGNWLLDDIFGAEISVLSKKDYVSKLPVIFKKIEAYYTKKGLVPYSIPTGGSNGMGLWGYIMASVELVQDFTQHGIAPQAIVCATGSGGTQGGLTLGMHLLETDIPVIGMAACDNVSYFEDKIIEDVSMWSQLYDFDDEYNTDLVVHTIDQYIGPGYGVGYEKVFDTIKYVAKSEGVLLDPVYTGKAFHGMLKEIESGRLKGMHDVVFVHTGGAFGVFPHSAEFNK